MQPLPRAVKIGDSGVDISGHRRAINKKLGVPNKNVSAIVRRTYGGFLDTKVNTVRVRYGGNPGQGIDDWLYRKLQADDCYDLWAEALLKEYAASHPRLTLCFPFPSNVNARLCQQLHPTAGLPGNWALDWCAVPGSPVVAVERAKIRKLSGRSPDDDTWDGQGVFGWSIHYENFYGYRYFWTHYGRRENLFVGQIVEAGEPLGYVGDQDFRPDHIHGGVTSPYGSTDAKKRITAVNNAKRVTL